MTIGKSSVNTARLPLKSRQPVRRRKYNDSTRAVDIRQKSLIDLKIKKKGVFKIGYYTWYNLTIENNVSHDEEVKAAKALAEITGFISPEKIEESYSPFGFISYDSMKWYDWESDMNQLARAFPDIVFCLWGEGEERDDNWRCYFHGEDEELQHGTITYAPRPAWSY